MKPTGQLDMENPDDLRRWLRRQALLAPRMKCQAVRLGGGVSNKAMWVTSATSSFVVKQALGQLRTKVAWFSPPERIHQEAAALRALHGRLEGAEVPACLAEDESQHVVVMTAVPAPHRNLKALLLQGPPPRRIGNRLGRVLSSLHTLAARDARTLARQFGETRFFETLRLEPYYLYTGAQLPAARGFMEELVRDCRQRRQTLVHGDFSPKNMLLAGEALYLLDYEAVHWGDATFDAGFCLAHLLSKAHHRPSRRRALARAARAFHATVQKNSPAAQESGWEGFAVRHTLGCLLARVAGRSPLEYLRAHERRKQQSVVLQMLEAEPKSVSALITQFLKGLDSGCAQK